MLSGEKILITGATGKIAFPIARALAADNEVWGAARLRDPADHDRLTATGVTPLRAYLGELVGVDPIFEYTDAAHTPLWPDVTRMHDILGRTKVPWREGFRRMVAARHPELELS
jgi:NAD(P)-dependent dehydrogenase (short-subunit alcohol dehydrogenase family)